MKTWVNPPISRIASRTDAKNQTTYDADGRLHTRTWARGSGLTTTYTYDNGGMLSGVDYSDATPDVTYVTRDRLGRPTMITDGTGTHNLAYRPDGQTLSASIPQVSGHSLGYGYDALGRRNALELHAPGSTLHATAYTYDGMSRLLTVSSTAELPLGTATYARVPGSNLLSSTVFNNGSSDVLTVSRSYDSLTRLESITSTPSASSAKSFTYIYNDRDQRTRCTLADGSYWVYQYDTLGQVTSGIKYDDDDQPIPGCTFGYAFDDIGNRKSATSDLTGTATYDPNTLNQYESRTVPGIIPVIGTANADTVVKIHRKALGDGPAAFIVPDRTGNIFHKNIAVDNANGPVTEELDVYCHKHLPGPPAQEIAAKASRTVTVPKSPETFTYDPDGNLLSDGLWTYTWDAENRLTSVESVSSVSNKTRLEFTYDYQSRRTAKKVYSWTGSAWQLAKTEKFVWDGWNLVAVFNASNEIQRSFCWAELGDLVADTDHIAGKSYLPIYDGNKNIHGYVDAADGSLVSEYDFDPFGRIVAQSGTGDFPFRFASYFRDEETGMVYYGYRYYAPEFGRFISQDPIEEKGGINLYCIVTNGATYKVDLLGLRERTDEEDAVFMRLQALQGMMSAVDATRAADLQQVIAFIDSEIQNASQEKFDDGGYLCAHGHNFTTMIGGLIIWAHPGRAQKYDGGMSGSHATCNIFVGDVLAKYNKINIKHFIYHPSIDLALVGRVPAGVPVARYPVATEWYYMPVTSADRKHRYSEAPSGIPGDIIVFINGHIGIYLGNNLYLSSTTYDDINIQFYYSFAIKRPDDSIEYIFRRHEDALP